MTKPQHVAIIMDGNGRWAKSRGYMRTYGHKVGLETARRIIAYASKCDIAYMSLFVFSTENWKRAELEVSYLMQLLSESLLTSMSFFKRYNIQVYHSGNLKTLDKSVQHALKTVIDGTCHHTGMILNLAINYGGHDEIIRIYERALLDGIAIHELNAENIVHYMDVPDMPAIDLLIRSGGERRISNFMLWHLAYSELFFSAKYWPDFGINDFNKALIFFNQRERRFGTAQMLCTHNGVIQNE